MNQKPSLKKKRAGLITGGTGFIGSHLTEHLLSNGWVIHLVVRETSNISNLKKLEPCENLYIHKHDGTTECLVSILRKVQPDVVFHLAAEAMVNHDLDQIRRLVESNVLFGTQMLEAMVHVGVLRFINTGTYWQHYQSKAYNPVDLYAAMKEAFECIIKYYTERTFLRSITLKLFDVYGPDDGRNKLFTQLENAYLNGETLMMSPGEQRLDLVYIDDVVRAFSRTADLICSDSAVKLQTDYAVTSLKYIPLRKVVETYQRVTKRQVQVNFGGRPYREREVMVPWKGRPVPGWKALIGLEAGIRLMTNIANKNKSDSTLEKSYHRRGFNYASN